MGFGKLWRLTFQNHEYIVEKKGELGSTKLRVSAVNFVMDAALVADLQDGGPAPAGLIDAFHANNLSLSNQYTVTVTKTDEMSGAPIKWKLNKGEREYFIDLKSGDTGATLAVTGSGGIFEDLSLGDYRVEMGGTIFSTFVSDSTFKADVDLTMTSTAQYILSGKFTFGEKFSADTRMYADFSVLDPLTDTPPRIVMLADFPADADPTTRVARLQGDVFFEFRDEIGEIINPLYFSEDIRSFTLRFLGRGELSAAGIAKIVVGGDGGGGSNFAELAASFSVDPEAFVFQLDVAGSLVGDAAFVGQSVAGANFRRRHGQRFQR